MGEMTLPSEAACVCEGFGRPTAALRLSTWKAFRKRQENQYVSEQTWPPWPLKLAWVSAAGETHSARPALADRPAGRAQGAWRL